MTFARCLASMAPNLEDASRESVVHPEKLRADWHVCALTAELPQ
ncbi:MAG: hypothetical protein P8L31_02670 [Pseudomonadales bacterium]|nr:hypothetical protein [Pseudomonadales bacterium]